MQYFDAEGKPLRRREECMAAETIVVTNQKGGVGKSTTAEAFSDGLARKGHKTLLIDLDPQCSITLTSGADMSLLTVYELMKGECDTQEAIQEHAQCADILPASWYLSNIEAELTEAGRESVLRNRLSDARAKYDYIVIDTPPSLGILTINALTAADSLIIPAQADVYSLQGIGQLYDTIEAVKSHTGNNFTLKGVLLTRHNRRNVISRDMTGIAIRTAEEIGTFLYNTVIRECVAIKEAQANQQSIFAYSPRCNASADYAAFIEEFLQRSAT